LEPEVVVDFSHIFSAVSGLVNVGVITTLITIWKSRRDHKDKIGDDATSAERKVRDEATLAERKLRDEALIVERNLWGRQSVDHSERLTLAN
jgi:hypothetical protein